MTGVVEKWSRTLAATEVIAWLVRRLCKKGSRGFTSTIESSTQFLIDEVQTRERQLDRV